ncbi:hypothetical protein PYCC9005_003921 [Savitreella phatthalungensis]
MTTSVGNLNAARGGQTRGTQTTLPSSTSSTLMPPPSVSLSAPASLRVPGRLPPPSTSLGPSARLTVPGRIPPSSSLAPPTTALPSRSDQQGSGIAGVGTGRAKVALRPGYSALDWARLSRDPSSSAQTKLRGSALAKAGAPAYVKISKTALAQSRAPAKRLLAARARPTATDDETLVDADMAYDNTRPLATASTDDDNHDNVDDDDEPLLTGLHARVYNLAAYLDFHPGGRSILLRLAVGRDCSSLFDKYHAWVNAHALLEPCLIGPLVDDHATSGQPAIPSR